jgi:DNA helicase II / ATP-dependent DNA helicase PcrA
MKLLGGLNPEQKAAAAHGEGPLLILAGAGSGKTRTLTCRIAYLIQELGVRPSEILAVTFTNKAAKEMRERVEKLIGGSSRGMWISTFHAACARMLREDIDKLGYAKNFNIIDSSDAVTVIKSCMKDLNISDRLYSPRAVAHSISTLKNSLTAPEDYADTANNGFGIESKVAKIYPLYQAKLKTANVLDFDDLLMMSVTLLQNHKSVLDRYQNNFRFVLVDEYQDTNPVQYRMLQLLASKHKNLCVVGDDDQSIYGWRGADIRNILEFEKDYKDTTVVKLEQNYRSTQRILDAAWSVVSNNPCRRPKKLWSDLGKGELMEHIQVPDECTEARTIAAEITKLSKAHKHSDFAVLYRTNTQSRVLEEALRRDKIPYVVLGGIKFYDRKEIKDLISYIKVIANPADSVNLRRIVNTPPRGIGEATMKKAEELATTTGIPLMEALTAFSNNEAMSPASRKHVSTFIEMMDAIISVKDSIPPSEVAARVIAAINYLECLRDSTDIEAQGRIENVKELLRSVQDFEARTEEPTLSDYLAEVSLMTDWDTVKANVPKVTLMTLHLSKGLEFPIVFIPGFEEGLIPHSQSKCSDAELEEERRLLYVGMTRAQKRLYLLSARTRRLAGLTQSNPESRFLEEIPEDLMHRKSVGFQKQSFGTTPTFHHPQQQHPPLFSREAAPAASTPSACPFKNGAQVNHPNFGVGVVEKVEGKGDDAKITVIFRNGGRKKLILKFANLTTK